MKITTETNQVFETEPFLKYNTFCHQGMVWSECKQLWEEGLKAYVRQWWNWLDFIMLSLYLTTCSLRAVAYFQIRTNR